MGDSLVKSGVSQNGQSPTMYDSPQQTVAAFDKGNVAPEMEANTYTPGLQYDESGGLSSPDVTKPTFLQSNNPKVASFEKPSLAEASATGKGLTKKGLLLNILLGAAGGAAAGAGTWGGEGFQRGAAFTNNRKLQFLNQQRQAQEQKRLEQLDARQQQQLDQNAAENKSQADLRTQQIEESKMRVGVKEKTPKQIYDQDIADGRTPAQALEHAYSIKPPAEHNQTEDSLAYTSKNDPDPAKRKAAADALEVITKNKMRVSAAGRSSAEGAREDKKRLDADVTGYYGHVISTGGDTSAAENIIKERLKDPKLTPYQKQVASETLRRVRAEQQSALR